MASIENSQFCERLPIGSGHSERHILGARRIATQGAQVVKIRLREIAISRAQQ